MRVPCALLSEVSREYGLSPKLAVSQCGMHRDKRGKEGNRERGLRSGEGSTRRKTLQTSLGGEGKKKA